MTNQAVQTTYRIRVKSHIENSLSDWFDGVKIQHEVDGHSLLTITLADQAAFVALLQRLHALGIIITDIAITGAGEH